jgi:hypothetical protein
MKIDMKIEPSHIYSFTLKDNLLQVHFYQDLDSNSVDKFYILTPLIESFDDSLKTVSDFRKLLPYKGELSETTLLLKNVISESVAEGWTVIRGA